MLVINSPASYQAGFNQAELLRDKGSVAEAAALYHALLTYWLQREESEPRLPFTINEFFIVDRLADLSLLLGNKKAAGFLLSALALQAKPSGNHGMCIQAVAKLTFVNLDSGLIAEVKKNLGMLSHLIGDVDNIAVTPDGLQVWEQSIKFDGANRQDQADQLVCLYDVLGAIKVAEGKFADGCLLYSRGIQIAELCPSPVTASRLLPMKVLLAGAFFGKGELQLAKKKLTATENEAGAAGIATGLPLQMLELRSRIALAEGEMGQAFELAAQTGDLCRKYRLPLAEIHADFNLAQAMVILNQTGEACDILQDCLTKAQNLGEAVLAARIDRFLQVAENSLNITLPPANYGAQTTQQKPPAIAETAPDTETADRPANLIDHFAEIALQFQVYLAKNEPVRAGEVLASLRALFKGCDSALLYFRLQVIEFTYLYYTNQAIRADWPFQRGLDYLSGNHLLPELWQFRRMLGHSGLIPENDNAAWLTENQAILDRITASLPVEMQTLYLLNKWSPNEEYLAAYSNILIELKAKTEKTKLPIISWFARRKFAKALLAFKEETGHYKDLLSRNVAAGNKPGAFTF